MEGVSSGGVSRRGVNSGVGTPDSSGGEVDLLGGLRPVCVVKAAKH